MTSVQPQCVFESCSRALVVLARSQRRIEARHQFGVCVACGIALSEHFDHANHLLSCQAAHERLALLGRTA